MQSSAAHPASYRDPSGFIFSHEGVIYRQVNKAYSNDYDVLMKSGLYNELTSKGLMVAHDEVEALLLANSSRYGLGGSIWTQDHKKGQELARQMESGAVFINALVASHPEMPFGGIKKSGYGRELSYIGIREFVNQKTIWLA